MCLLPGSRNLIIVILGRQCFHSLSPNVKVSLVAESNREVSSSSYLHYSIVAKVLLRNPNGRSCLTSSLNTQCSTVPPGIDCTVFCECQRVSRTAVDGGDSATKVIEGNSSGKFAIRVGGLSESAIFVETCSIDSVIFGEETEVVLSS